MDEHYPVSKKNKIRQLSDYANYDREAVQRILDGGLVAQVGFIDDASTVVVPMIYGRKDDVIFLHGARKARIIRMLEQNNEVCLNVTLVDGLVLARSAFNSSMRYRSVTVFGKPKLVKSMDEKIRAMRIISEHSMPGRWDELRAPFEREVKMTGVIELCITAASAKESRSMPDDEDDDYDIPIWAGVLPLTAAFGELIGDARLLPGVEPSTTAKSLQGRIV